MKRKLLLIVVAALALLALGAGVVWAKGGFDQWGYNYQAHIFNGLYSNAGRPEPPCDPGTCPSSTYLVMKWSDVWLSNVDSNDDEKLDRGYVDCRGLGTNTGLDQSHCPGAWVTNHQRGEYEQDGKACKWTYFVKIVYPGYMPTDVDNDDLDDVSGARIIWGAFVVIQGVYNDPCGGFHGIEELVRPPGFGAW